MKEGRRNRTRGGAFRRLRANGGGGFLHRVGDTAATVGRHPPSKRSLRLALQLGLAVAIFGFLVFTVASQWSEVRERDLRFEAGWLAAGLAVLAVFYVYAGLGWDLVVRFLGHRVSPTRAQMVWGQSLLARYVPGSVLYVVGRVVLAEREGVPRRTTLASMVYEIGLQFAAAAMIATWFLIDHPDLADQPLRWVALAVVPAVLIGFHPRVFAPVANRGFRALGREPLPVVMSFRGVVAMLAFYAVAWSIVGLGVYLVARSMHPLPISELPVVISAQALAFCAAVVTLVFPGGLGVRDTALAWAIKVALPGGSFALGAAIAIAVRLSMTAVEVVYVAAVSAIGRPSGPGVHAAGPSQPAESSASRPVPPGTGSRGS